MEFGAQMFLSVLLSNTLFTWNRLAAVRTLFWDTELDGFQPEAYPDYTIFRVLEYGDDEAVTWMRQMFPEPEVRGFCLRLRLRT